MIDYDYKTNLGEVVSAVKIKALFEGLDIDAEIKTVRELLSTPSNSSNLLSGSDKIAWTADDEAQIILKLAEGSQIKKVPVGFVHLFEPFYEYILSEPIEYRDIIFYRVQIQRKAKLLIEDSGLDYYPTNKIKIYANGKGIDKNFLWALFEKYDEEFVIDFCRWGMETGVNRSNWGLIDGDPKIFDYGSILNEKWRENALIRDGYYYEDGLIKEELPE